MSKISNAKQKVDFKKYDEGFERAFGKREAKFEDSGTYVLIGGGLVKIDNKTPKSVRDVIDPLMVHGVRRMSPIPVEPARVG